MSQLAPTQPNCPTDCSSALPVMDFSKCAPKTNAAQFQKIYMTGIGWSLSDWTQSSEWVSRLSNAANLPDAIRTMHVIASKPKPESNVIPLSLGRKKQGTKKHSIPFKIDETNFTNLEMVRTFECGGQVLIWAETSGGLLMGGNSGIEASIEIDVIITDDSGAIITIEGQFTWEEQFTPEFILSPIAA